MSNKGYKEHLLKKQTIPVLYWTIISIVSLILFITPYFKGLFNGGSITFQLPINITLISCMVLLMLVSVFFYKNWKLESLRDIFSLFIWLIPLSYLLSQINAASPFQAKFSFYISISYVVMFLVGAYFSNTNKSLQFINYSILFSGYIIVLFGLLNWFGQVHYQDSVLDLRLSNVFQYANAYAAFLLALIVLTIFNILVSKKLLWRMLHSFMLVPVLLSFLLTLSRAGYILLPILILLCLPLFTLFQQIKLIVNLLMGIVLSISIYNKVWQIGLAMNKKFSLYESLQGWAFIGIACLVGAALILLIQKVYDWYEGKYIIGSEHKMYKNFIIPAILLVLGLFLIWFIFNNSNSDLSRYKFLPDLLIQRINSISSGDSSFSYRLWYYGDAIQVVKDYPFFGAGGNGWSGLYELYQTAPYTSRQVHNFYVQYLVETGLFGTCILLVLLFGVYSFFLINHFKRNENYNYRIPSFIVVTAILVHSMFDFDMSFLYLAMLVFLGLGIMVSESRNMLLKNKLSNILSKFSRANAIILSIAVLILFFNSIKLLRANTMFENAQNELKEQKRFSVIMENLNKAISLEPKQLEYVLLKINLLKSIYSQTRDEKYYIEASNTVSQYLSHEPQNSAMLEQQYSLYIAKSDLQKALQNVINQLEYRPWNISLFERAIVLYNELGNAQMKQGHLHNSFWESALDLYNNTLLMKINEFNNMPAGIRSGTSFVITSQIYFAIGKIEFFNKDFEKATELLRASVSSSSDEKLQSEMYRWYIASLIKAEKPYKELMDSFVLKYPEAKAQIEEIVSTP
ncbi:tetratricopeptide (TPR) repeat protein [Paenibacillus sp. V4I3]|uniref:O-antigen ligase family protein n=1 Tax=Paenibacillus sp. V4I3 TaxID=3042305 RepID=UPI00277E5CD6|nr:O-antigen ligase family protein [Paenibacillus sp. V4I3]MDQ0873149.1 tetratricopeptide (TPR) repeat protein [Paenibacillus sp. V4I3]